MKIGIDFDNTIACYDAVFAEVACGLEGLPETLTGTKRDIREAVRNLPDGEKHWMRLQGQVYGPHMSAAAIFDGFEDFLIKSKRAGAEVFIVSHKSEYGHFDESRTSLHKAARNWMADKKLFDSERYGLFEGAVYFETTRSAKVARIASLGLDIFIDDLVEVFEHAEFPTDIRKWLFAAGESDRLSTPGLHTFSNWHDIGAALENTLS